LPAGGFKLPGFHMGGGFTVAGRGGVDSNLLSLNGLPIARVSYGERVNISNDNSRSSPMSRGDVTMHVYTNDADSFRRSERQINRDLRRRIG
jgi:hypothetical protein